MIKLVQNNEEFLSTLSKSKPGLSLLQWIPIDFVEGKLGLQAELSYKYGHFYKEIVQSGPANAYIREPYIGIYYIVALFSSLAYAPMTIVSSGISSMKHFLSVSPMWK